MKKVMVFGTFDILHPGHIHMLKEAKEYGNFLVAVVARDVTVNKVKEKAPQHDETVRVENLKKLHIADKVILGSENEDKHAVISNEQPDVIALGYDQRFFLENLENALKDSAKIVRLSPYMPEIFKSSKLPETYEITNQEDSNSDN